MNIVRKIVSFLAIYLGLFASGAAQAYGATNGVITALRIDHSTNRVFVQLGNATGGTPPSCATGTGYTGVMSLESAGAQNTLSLLISAREDGVLVYIRGNDTCTVISNFEDIGYITVQEG
tara:strand:- start:695 stop:1054 length:360 start_codon:yes stop_codon:yes gene_type:complete